MGAEWLQSEVSSAGGLFNDPETTEETKEVEEVESTEESTEEVEETVETEETVEETEELEETTEEETETEENQEPLTDYGNLLQGMVDNGSLFYDEEKDYEDSQEGVEELLKDNIEKRSEERLNEYKESIGEDGQEILDFIENGGSVDKYLEYKNGEDYSQYSLETKDGEDDINNQEQFVYVSLKSKGMDDESISDVIQVAKDKGTLRSKAEKAKEELVSKQESEKAEYLKSSKEKQEAEEKERSEEAEAFRDRVVNTSEIKGFKLTKDKAAKLHKFITEPVDEEGNTEFSKKDNEETRLLYALFAMNNFDKESLAKEERKKATISLKKKLSKTQDPRANLKNKAVEEKSNEEPSIGSMWNIKGF